MWNEIFFTKFDINLINVFIWYPKYTRVYNFYNPFKQKMIVAGKMFFLAKEFVSKTINGRNVDLKQVQDSQSSDTPIEKQDQDR